MAHICQKRSANHQQDATATTYLLQCVPGTDSSDCGFPAPVTLTEGPATAAYTIPAILDNNGSVALYAMSSATPRNTPHRPPS